MPLKDPDARKEYHRQYMQQYLQDPERRKAHLERVRQNSESKRILIKGAIADHLSRNPCVDCKESDPEVLDFDHVRGEKKFNIGNAARLRVSMDLLIQEIAKCEVRCSNCHRRVTRRRERESCGTTSNGAGPGS